MGKTRASPWEKMYEVLTNPIFLCRYASFGGYGQLLKLIPKVKEICRYASFGGYGQPYRHLRLVHRCLRIPSA